MTCDGSNTRHHVSNYQAAFRQAPCPVCGKQLKITIPDRKMHGNTARFPKHVPKEKSP